jgi:hypothetical protein
MVPPTHGAWLAAHIPGADVVVEAGEGHLPNPEAVLERMVALVR